MPLDQLTERVNEAERLLTDGALDLAAEGRHRLLESIAQNRPSDELVVWRARILASQLFLPRLELNAAEAALGVAEFERDIPDHILERCQKSPCIAGLWTAEVANLKFRRGDYQRGAEIANHALALLKIRSTDTGGFAAQTSALLEVLAYAWFARLKWQLGARREARVVLDEQIARIQLLRRQWFASTDEASRAVNGADGVLALLLDLAADYDASIGKTDVAALLAQWGVMLLREGSARDRPRLAHMLYVLGKIEGRRGAQDGYVFATKLLRSAVSLYADHPLRYRALNQEAVCLVRAGSLERAGELLSKAERELASDEHVTRREQNYVRINLKMTRLWILSREARNADPTQEIALWERCKHDAKQIESELSGKTSTRLLADCYLQLGLAQTKLNETPEAEEALRKAFATAANGDHVTIQVAALFMLCELLHQQNRIQESVLAFKQGCQLIESRGVGSAYLRTRRDEVSALLRQPLILKIDPESSYHDAELDFRKAYVSYHLARAKSVSEFEVATKVPRTTLLRWLKELGLPGL